MMCEPKSKLWHACDNRMNFAPDLAAITHAIQLAVAPVFLLAAVSGIITAVAGRLGRIIDRARLPGSVGMLFDRNSAGHQAAEVCRVTACLG